MSTAVLKFLKTEAGGGMLLVFGALAAIVVTNSPFAASYFTALRTPPILDLGFWTTEATLKDWVRLASWRPNASDHPKETSQDLLFGHAGFLSLPTSQDRKHYAPFVLDTFSGLSDRRIGLCIMRPHRLHLRIQWLTA